MEETNYGLRVSMAVPYEEAVRLATDALKSQGFGVLTTIDVKQTLKSKLDRDFRKYVILGACNPPLAFNAISTDPSIGLLLPCNVTVEWLANGRTGVRLTDPEALLGSVMQRAPELASVAHDARARMVRVAESLAKA